MDALTGSNLQTSRPEPRDAKLWAASQALEANFLSEMLRSGGFGQPRETFGGGEGEQHFSGMLAAEYAKTITATGGIGLAETIYKSLVAKEQAG